MHTEFTLKIEFHASTKESVITYIQALREAGKELYSQAALLSGENPTISLTIENNAIGIKKVKVFNQDT